MRQHAAALLNAMNADFERATGNWEIEWLYLPEIFCYTAGALAQAKFMLGGLVVHPDKVHPDKMMISELLTALSIRRP